MGKKGKKGGGRGGGGGGGGQPGEAAPGPSNQPQQQQQHQEQQRFHDDPQDFPALGGGGRRGGRGGGGGGRGGGGGGGRPQPGEAPPEQPQRQQEHSQPQDIPQPGGGGRRGGRGGGGQGGGGGRPQPGEAPPEQSQRQQEHSQPRDAPQDIPQPGGGRGRGRGRPQAVEAHPGTSYQPEPAQRQHQQQQDFPRPGGEGRGRGRGRPQPVETQPGAYFHPEQPQRQQQQQHQQPRFEDVPQDFSRPGGEGDSRRRGGKQQQRSGPQEASLPTQPMPSQQFPQGQRMQPPGIPVGDARPVSQQQQARLPLQTGPRGQPTAWRQRGPSPQQMSQPQSRETTPTSPPLVSPVASVLPIRPQSSDQQQTRPQPFQPPAEQQAVAPQPKSPPAGSALAKKMESLSVVSSLIPPKRAGRPPDPKKGREILVETNHLNLNIKNKGMVIHHYDVSINPEKPFRNYRAAVEAVRRKCFAHRFPAFDGKKNLYSYPELPLRTSELVETVSIYDNERDQEKEMTVTIKYATQVNVSMIWDYLRCGTSTNAPQEAIQALDVVLRQPAANRFVTVGRSFFTPPPGRAIDLGYGLDLWYGFFQSAIIGWKPFLNIDVAHKGFPAADNCVDALKKFISGRVDDPNLRIQHYEMDSFVSYIKDLKVAYEIPSRGIKRTYKVNNISTCPRDNRFEVVDRETNNRSNTTVENYFGTQYNYRLRYPHLPCLSVGSREKPLSLPLELCRIIEGQVTMKKMNDAQTRTMVREAAVDTDRRKDKIKSSIAKINFNADPCLKEFGLSVDSDFTRVKARIMNAPTVKYLENPVTVRQGVWRSERFIKGAELSLWRIVNTNQRGIREQDLRNLANGLINHGRDCGMNISNNYLIATLLTPIDLEQYFKKCLQEKVKLVIVVLPDRGIMTYASIKKVAELQVGILTQCLKSITVQKRLNAATFINILQKVNAKLNGVNHHITDSYWPRIFQRPVIVVGADVTHPAPDQINVPSIAAVAASQDPRAFRYNMIWKLQPPREEVIRDLQSIMKDQLLTFYRSTRYKPEAILFYRDGVSEGQFKTILNQELMAIRKACSSLSVDYKPPITFIVVQKRHHTRFFPQQKDADGRNKNVPAGTVVDTDITHPTELDFYLVSHASIQGTARPTKYHLLWDDSSLSEQSLEEITYYLCHLFTRCTRSVSYPAPTYYAHLAAFRARAYTDTERLQLDRLPEEQIRRKVQDSVGLENPMFFV